MNKIIVSALWFLKAEIFSCNIKKMVYRITYIVSCTRWRSWLRHGATSRKAAGLIPVGVTGIFHGHNPSCCTVALGST